MLKIRLKKYGRKKQPSYRIVVIDNRKRRDGRPIEEIGFYNPLSEKRYIDYKKLGHYKQNGAQMSKTVKLLSNNYNTINIT